MLETLKKQWFVVVIAIVFLAGIGYYVNDAMSQVVGGKSVDGKDVVYTINDTNYTADELYSELEDKVAASLLAMRFEQSVVNQTVQLTEDEMTDAKLQADDLLAAYKSNYGDNAEMILDQVMKSIGFVDHTHLNEYFEFMARRSQVIDGYLEAHFDEYWPAYAQEFKPRLASHILVKIADFDNITEAEQKRMDDVDAALAAGDSFEDVAKEFSEDTSAANGGALGFVNKDTTFVEEFLEVVLEQEAGDVSGWVKTDYGYHIITTTATEYDDLKDNADFITDFNTQNPSITGKAIMQEAENLQIDFHGNSELESAVRAALGLEDAE